MAARGPRKPDWRRLAAIPEATGARNPAPPALRASPQQEPWIDDLLYFLKHNEYVKRAGTGLLALSQIALPEGRAAAELPAAARLGNAGVQRVMRAFRSAEGALPFVREIHEPGARQMASAYEALQSAPANPAVRQAYRAFVDETRAQFDALKKSGINFEFVAKDPYKNSAEMMTDVARGRLKVLKTNAANPHPLMTNEENDIFRAVHDLQHAGHGQQFGPIGEENITRAHAATYSPLARRAMMTETRGQNSWVNFGPQAAGLAPADRPFATQKAALWPEHLMGDYKSFPEPPAPFDATASVPAFVRRGASTYNEPALFPNADVESYVKMRQPPIPIEHYGPPGLTELDPAKMGSPGGLGVKGETRRAERGGYRLLERGYAYNRGAKPEDLLKGAARYQGELPSERVADIATMPDVREMVRKGEDFERELARRGFVGYRNSASANPDAIAVFEKTPLRRGAVSGTSMLPPILGASGGALAGMGADPEHPVAGAVAGGLAGLGLGFGATSAIERKLGRREVGALAHAATSGERGALGGPTVLYRIEDRFGNGPYNSYPAGYKGYPPLGEINDVERRKLRQPYPEADIPEWGPRVGFGTAKNHKFGFMDLDQLKQWFSPQELATFHKNGFKLSAYHAPSTLHSAHQAAGPIGRPFASVDIPETLRVGNMTEAFGRPAPDPVEVFGSGLKSDLPTPKAPIPAGLKTSKRGRALHDALLRDEAAILTNRGIPEFEALAGQLPSTANFGAGAVAGKTKLGWYANSAKALGEAYGPEAPRFAALLASLSPQQPVEKNLQMAIDTWDAWLAAGRPSDPRKLTEVLHSVSTGPERKQMGSRIPNAIRALTADDPVNLVLSGPKVNAFHKNLIGDTQRVTLDTWMAQLANLNPELLGGMTRKSTGGIGVASPTYLAYSGRIRQTADELSRTTGRAWTPAEVQETLWSWGKALSENALPESQGLHPNQMSLFGPRDLRSAISGLPDEAIANTPDFATLLRRGGFGGVGMPAQSDLGFQVPPFDVRPLAGLAKNIMNSRAGLFNLGFGR